MNMIKKILSRMKPEDRLYHDWQFALARRLLQIIEERGLTQRDVARLAKLTDAQVSAIVHADANPSLRTLARIAALLEAELLSWKDTDHREHRTDVATEDTASSAAVYHLAAYATDLVEQEAPPLYREIAAS